MVKIKGPMLSATASGSLGPATTLASWKGRAYARKKGAPADPRSPQQMSYRALLAFLAERWKTLTTLQQATWFPTALDANVPPYNAFMAHNLELWSNFKAPTKAFGALPVGTLPSLSAMTATGGVAHIKISQNWNYLADGWGLCIFHSRSSGFAVTKEKLIHVSPLLAKTGLIYTFRSTDLGTHYFNFISFTHYGKQSTPIQYRSAVIT